MVCYTEMDDGKLRSSQQQKADISEGNRYTKEESSYQEASRDIRHGKNTIVSDNVSFQNPQQFKTDIFDERKMLKSPIQRANTIQTIQTKPRQDDEYQDKIGLFSGLRENYAWCSGRLLLRFES